MDRREYSSIGGAVPSEGPAISMLAPSAVARRKWKDGSVLAVPRAGSGEVEVLGRDISWGRVGKVKLDNLQQKEIVTCLDWGNKASYIIAATSKVSTVPFSVLCL